MEIGNDQGIYGANIAKENRAKVAAWFKENPGQSVTECSKALGISRPAIYRHIAVLTIEKGGKIER